MTSLISKKTNFKTRCENSAPIQAKRKRKIRKCEKMQNKSKRNEAKILFVCFAN
jgi:hypothetical protein